MSLTVKICGLGTPATIAAAIRAGADMVGFVFVPKSPRNVTVEDARALAPLVPGTVRKVALVVDADDDCIAGIVGALRPDLLQLHGREPPERVAAIRHRFAVPVMKAIGIADTGDLAAIPPYRTVANAILVDAKPPRDAAYPGGHGRAFDWSILERGHGALDPDLAFMLSGGLHAGNVGDAVRRTHPWGVDVSSGVETAPGVKDTVKIAAFIAAARAADQSA